MRCCTNPSARSHSNKTFLWLQLRWTEQCFFVFFLSHPSPDCSSVTWQIWAPFSDHFTSLAPRNPHAVFAGLQLLLNIYFRQRLSHFPPFLKITRTLEPPAGFMDLILRQINNYPGHCILILFPCLVWQNHKNGSHPPDLLWMTFLDSAIYHPAYDWGFLKHFKQVTADLDAMTDMAVGRTPCPWGCIKDVVGWDDFKWNPVHSMHHLKMWSSDEHPDSFSKAEKPELYLLYSNRGDLV